MHTTHQASPCQRPPDWLVKRSSLEERFVAWALDLVVRTDVQGVYYIHSSSGSVEATTRHRGLTSSDLANHFSAEGPDDIRGLHVTSPEETGRLVVIDFDVHNASDDADANWEMAYTVYDWARKYGMDAFLLDSNGAGGFHVWIVFKNHVPLVQGFRLGRWLTQEYASFGIARRPESFPKSASLSGKRFGGWIRIPGKHHKRSHWSRAWCPDRKGWLDWAESVELIVGVRGIDVDLEAILPPESAVAGRSGSESHRTPSVTNFPSFWVRQQYNRARNALTYLNDQRDDYDTWLRVGMALRELDETGLALWHEWSNPSAKYDALILDQKWETFRAGGEGSVRLGTLFHLAQGQGWSAHPRAGKFTRVSPFVHHFSIDRPGRAPENRSQS